MVVKPGSVVHVEFTSKDPKASQRFFSDVFGWKWKRFGEMPYWVFSAPSEPNGGMGPVDRQQSPVVTNYLLVKDIDRTLIRIARRGGKVTSPKGEIPSVGFSAQFEAPGGVTMALFQPISKASRASRRAR